MAQRPRSGHQSTQPDSLPATPSNTQWETQGPWSTTFSPWTSTQESQPTVQTRQTSTQESQPTVQTRQTGTQESQPTAQTRQTGTQESQPTAQTRQTGTQGSQPTAQSRQTGTQGSQPTVQSRQTGTQGSQPIIQSQQTGTRDSQPTAQSRRVSIQEPLPILHSRRVSIREPLPILHSHRASNQDSLLINIQRLSAEDTASISSSHHATVQDTRSISYSRHLNPRDVPPTFQTHHLGIQSLSSTSCSPLAYTSQVSIQPTTQSTHSNLPGSMSPVRAKVDVPPSITYSPEASIKSLDESIIWTSQESFKDSLDGFQIDQHALESNIHSLPSGSSIEGEAGRFQDRCIVSHSQLPMGWRLLHEAKKFSRQLSLVLCLAGMVIIGLISLGQPWIHFQVPLAPPGDPAGSKTIPINTIFFVRCPDISCMHEYDQNAYLLDFAWAFLLFASVASLFLCIILINIIFFTSTNMPMLDFSSIITSILTGTSMTLGVLFYLMQAHEYLQEGMTYKLGLSFYLAWIGVFLFFMTGFFSYLNYIHFWSLLAIQAIWT